MNVASYYNIDESNIKPCPFCGSAAEQGGDGQLHFVCPKWDKKE